MKKIIILLLFLMVGVNTYNVRAAVPLESGKSIYFDEYYDINDFSGFSYLGTVSIIHYKWDGLVKNKYIEYYDFLINKQKIINFIDTYSSSRVFTSKCDKLELSYIQTTTYIINRTVLLYSEVDCGSMCSTSSSVRLWENNSCNIEGYTMKATVSEKYGHTYGYEYCIGLYEIKDDMIILHTQQYERGSLWSKKTYVVEKNHKNDTITLGYMPIAVNIYEDFKMEVYFRKIYNNMRNNNSLLEEI